MGETFLTKRPRFYRVCFRAGWGGPGGGGALVLARIILADGAYSFWCACVCAQWLQNDPPNDP